MKKKVVAFLLIIVELFTLILFSGCSLWYSFEHEEGFGIGYSKRLKSAFIAEVEYEKDSSFDIELPSLYKGVPVRSLGGYYGRGVPCSFYINIKIEEYYPDANYYYTAYENYAESFVDNENYQIFETTFVFNITLPAYLDKVELADTYIVCAEYYDEETNITELYIINPTYYFTISESNKYFYTENGKLYNKKDKTLVNV